MNGAREFLDYIRPEHIRPTSPEYRWMHGTAEEAAAVEDLAIEAAATLAAHWRAVDGTASDRINHSPGGSPNPLPPAAPAPCRLVHIVATADFTCRPDLLDRAPDGRINMSELRSRSYAAARQVTRGKQWSDEQRQDIASTVVENVLRRTHWTGTRHGTARDVLAWITFCETFPHEAKRRELANTGTVPKDAASGLVLMRLALNARETVGVRHEASDNDDDFTSGVHVDGPGEQLRRQPDLTATPRAARLAAVQMLEDLDLATSWGPMLTVAYTAARAPWGTDGRDIATELDMSYTAYRKHLSRGHKLMGENVHSELWMRASLRVLDPMAGSGAHIRKVPELGWRGLDRTVPAETAVKQSTSRKRTGKPRRTPAAWTADLPERTRNRLHAAATARQDRAGLAPADRTRATL